LKHQTLTYNHKQTTKRKEKEEEKGKERKRDRRKKEKSIATPILISAASLSPNSIRYNYKSMR